VLAEAGCKHAVFASQFIPETDHARARLLDPRADGNLIVVTGGEEEAAADLRDGQQYAVLLHIAVPDAAGAAQLDAPDLHPDEVIGVIYHSHLVRFGIPHADARVTLMHSHRLYERAGPECGT
jgi:hypothetical protein